MTEKKPLLATGVLMRTEDLAGAAEACVKAGYTDVHMVGNNVIGTLKVPEHLRAELLGGMRSGYSIGCRSTSDLG